MIDGVVGRRGDAQRTFVVWDPLWVHFGGFQGSMCVYVLRGTTDHPVFT